MISLEVFEEYTMETADSFPEVFFREPEWRSHGQSRKPAAPAAEDHDLFILGEYHIDRYLGRFIVLYYGSFAQCYGTCSEEEIQVQIRKVLLHEFRHHLESLAGERDLEIEDAVNVSQYKAKKRQEKT